MLRTVALICILAQLSGCGTLFYPERRGQKAGEIDIKIAIADGVGLFFGIIPGVIAYVVDYSTGAIYLPYGHKQTVSTGRVKVVMVDPGLLRDKGNVRKIIARETGLPEALVGQASECAIDRSEDIPTRLAEAEKSDYGLFPLLFEPVGNGSGDPLYPPQYSQIF